MPANSFKHFVICLLTIVSTASFSQVVCDSLIGTTQTISNLPNGDYTVVVTDVTSGCTQSDNVTIYQPNNLSINVTVEKQNTCTGNNAGEAKSTTTGGTSPHTNIWSNGAAARTISNLANGTYTTTVTDAAGCTVVGSVVIEPKRLIINASAQKQNTCTSNNQGIAKSVASNATTPYTNKWSNGGTTQTISNLANGVYTVTVTDAAGCTGVGSVTIEAQSNFSIDATPQSANTCTSTNAGSAKVTTYFGTGPFSYKWSNGANTSTIGNLANGIYTVTVTDATGCSLVSSVEIFSVSPMIVDAFAQKHNTCSSTNAGIAKNIATGGTPPYKNKWSNGGTTQTISNLANGIYTVTVTDAAGCTRVGAVEIISENSLGITATAQKQNTCTSTNAGIAKVTASGVSPYVYTYKWYKKSTVAKPVITQSGQDLTSSQATAYQWFLNGTAINNAVGKIFTPGTSGFYQVRATYSNNCTAFSDSLQVIISGINDFSFENKLKVYPNPAFDVLHIEGLPNDDHATFIEIYNTTGMLVLKEKATPTLAIHQLEQGYYVLKLTGASTSTKSCFIKQK